MKTSYLIFSSIMAATASAWAEATFPMVFFAEINEVLEPLSSIQYSDYSVFTFGSTPVEFKFQHVYAYTNDTMTPGYAGFQNYDFGFGPEMLMNQLFLDPTMQVQNHLLYACEGLNPGVRVISYNYNESNCFPVNVYLLPYDRRTKAPVSIPTFLEPEEAREEEHEMEPGMDREVEPSFDKVDSSIHSVPKSEEQVGNSGIEEENFVMEECASWMALSFENQVHMWRSVMKHMRAGGQSIFE